MANLRNINDDSITSEVRSEIISGVRKKTLTYKEIESKYAISAVSVRNYLRDQIDERYFEEFPKPSEPKKNYLEQFLALTERPLYSFIFSILFSFLLFIGFVKVPYLLKFCGLDPLSNLIFSANFASGALLVLMITSNKHYIYFTDISNFKYFLRGHGEKDYSHDLNNGLTTWERLKINQDKQLKYLFCYVALYIAILNSYPTLN